MDPAQTRRTFHCIRDSVFQTDCTRKWYPWHDCRIVEQNEEDVALINQNTKMTCASGDLFYEEVVRERCDL